MKGKSLKQYIFKNWFWIIAGIILTRKAIEIVYLERGYEAVGGEYLILPLLLMFVEFGRFITWFLFETLETDDEEGDEY